MDYAAPSSSTTPPSAPVQLNLESIEEIVVAFYRSPQQQAVHQWLLQNQMSMNAWQFCWTMMQTHKPNEVQFFGATTLHLKLMKCWHEIPPKMHEELKEKLMQAIIMYGTGSKLILNRLCISLSAFIVHILEEWPSAVEDVVKMFKSQQLPNLTPAIQIWIMFEVLAAIPESAQTAFNRSTRRAVQKAEIAKSTKHVLKNVEEFVTVKCESGGDSLTTDEDWQSILNAIKCIAPWIKMHPYPLNECESIVTTLLKVVNKCYWSKTANDGCMSHEESEISEAALKALSSIMVQPEAHKFPASALAYLKLMLAYLCDITKAEWCENNSNEDVAYSIYTMLLCTLECHSMLILTGITTPDPDHHQVYVKIVEEILHCTNKPGIYPVEESCSSSALGFWYLLQDEVLSLDNLEERRRCLEAIKPVYLELVKILIRKSRIPDEDSATTWSADDLEAFRCYRQDIADTLLFCLDVLSDQGVLALLFESLSEALCDVQTDITQWPKLEASIYGFYAVAQQLDCREYVEIVNLMKLINTIPFEKLNKKLLGTALETIGAYSEWLHENPQYLPIAMELLVKGLNSPMSAQATLGLKDLTTNCQFQLQPYAVPLLNACQQSLASDQLSNKEAVRLMHTIGNLLSMLPVDTIPASLDLIAWPCFEDLQRAVGSRDTSNGSQLRILFRLNMIATLFASLNINKEDKGQSGTTVAPPVTPAPQQPLLIVLEKTMPIFNSVCELWIHNEKVVEALCMALQNAVTNLMDEIKPVVGSLCCLVVSIIQSKCAPPAIQLATCICMFGVDADLRETTQKLYGELLKYLIKFFQETPPARLPDVSDVLESFYSSNVKILKRIQSIYADTDANCAALLYYAILSIRMAETGPIKRAATFLTLFVKVSRNYPVMLNAILADGQHIVTSVLECINGVHLTPRTQVEVFADVLLSLNQKYPSEFVIWMKEAETAAVSQFSLVSPDERAQFAKMVVKEKTNKRLLQDNIRRHAAKCRGILEEL